MTLDQFLLKYRVFNSVWFTKNRLVCNDGFSISVQCGCHAYCIPKENNSDPAYYIAFELEFPNQSDDLIIDYAEEYDRPTKTIYAFVAREIVEELIAKHGGIKD